MQVCQLAKTAGRADLLPQMLEEVRGAFAKLQPAAVAELLSWLPQDLSEALLHADVSKYLQPETNQ